MYNIDQSSDQTSSSPKNTNKRLADLRKKLSVNIKKFLDDSKAETQEIQKDSPNASKKITNLQQVQCMKDVKSQIGFFHEYNLEKKLGEGCHSSVYKCISKKQNKSYAVKVTKQKDLQLFENIRQSYRILKKLQHENIIQAKNLFINQKHMTCHLVLQYCEWQDLNVSLKSRKDKISKEEISNILIQLLKTVAYMHNSGVCHRDIKPDNILYNQKKGKLKIIDFEIARIKKYANSKLQMMTRTSFLSYRAPQMLYSIYDERVDIWSIGVIAYQLLTSKLPFEAQYEKDQMDKIMNKEPNYDGLSVWQQDLLQKLLCKDPNKRATVAEALSSAFFLVNAKLTDQPNIKCSTLIKSPSLGKEQFQQSTKQNSQISSRFYDDDITSMFLGNNEGDIGVIRYSSSSESDE